MKKHKNTKYVKIYKTTLIVLLLVIFIYLLYPFIFQNQTDISLPEDISNESTYKKDILGYCPTMYDDALILARENNYTLKEFDSASLVLNALNMNLIDKALIGRKAYLQEIHPDINEEVLKSGYTLVSNKRAFIDLAQLNSMEIYIPENYTEFNFTQFKYYYSEVEAVKLISEGKIVLISWDIWQNEFELILVTQNNLKVKDFRGNFLYFRN